MCDSNTEQSQRTRYTNNRRRLGNVKNVYITVNFRWKSVLRLHLGLLGLHDSRLVGIICQRFFISKPLCRFMSIAKAYTGVLEPYEQVLSQILSASPHGLRIICLTYRLSCLYCFPLPLEHCNLSATLMHVGHSFSQIPCYFSNRTCLKPSLIGWYATQFIVIHARFPNILFRVPLNTCKCNLFH